jgi:hypothetical protein
VLVLVLVLSLDVLVVEVVGAPPVPVAAVPPTASPPAAQLIAVAPETRRRSVGSKTRYSRFMRPAFARFEQASRIVHEG